MDSFYIGDKRIGPDCPPFLIAEMSGNHNQSLQRALDLVDAAAESGAHAIKLQTYTADTITLNQNSEEFQHPLWDEMQPTVNNKEVYNKNRNPEFQICHSNTHNTEQR